MAIPAMEAELGISKTQLGIFLTLHAIYMECEGYRTQEKHQEGSEEDQLKRREDHSR